MIHFLLAQIQAVLEQEFVGLYLHGSLALGDFDSCSSDIDFAVVTKNHLKPVQIGLLEELHKKLLKTHPQALLLEGSYIPLAMFKRHDPLDSAVPCVHGESFYLAQLEPHWILSRAILRARGVTVFGPEANTLIDSISTQVCQNAVRDFLHDWWEPMLSDPVKLQDAEYRVYAVQTMARAICTLKTGELYSKPSAVRWALEHLGSEFCATLHHVLDWSTGGFAPPLEKTSLLIKHAVTLAQDLEPQPARITP